MLKKLVIASNNSSKLREIEQLLAPLNIEVIAQSSLGINETEEPYCTFVENALAKARHASLYSGLPALADDSGLCLEALNGAPGVHSAYFAGLPKNDEKNNTHLLKVLKQHSNRYAHYYCCIVLVRRHDDPQPLIAEGIWQGAILKKPRGENGFGYDPLFMDSMTGKSGAELAPEIKNKISHRGQAMRKMLLLIENLPSD
ncbi:MAG: RdgB/HAM1 family non-canonical purine NTP pyrophosphatase [Methylophilaceae bacterium]